MTLSGTGVTIFLFSFPEMGWMLAGLTLLVGLLAGSYPALILSGFSPIDVLKSKIKVNGANLFTKSLVTVQFALSIGLIICTIIILQQTRYMSSKNPGFNRDNIVVVESDYRKAKKYTLCSGRRC